MHQHHYPTLYLIDHAEGLPPTRFAEDPAAPCLERRACRLIAEYWSDSVWLTGKVSEVALSIVQEILERERRALSEANCSWTLADPLAAD